SSPGRAPRNRPATSSTSTAACLPRIRADVQSASAEPAVAVDRVTKRFGGITAVDDVSFVLVPGEVVALVGENGAGKSTIKNLLAGIVKPDSGSLVVDGANIYADGRA